MSFPQFGYSYSASSQIFVSATSSATCCTSGSRAASDVSSGSSQTATLGCTSYENRLLAGSRTELNAALGIYGSPYAAAGANPGYANYLPYNADPSSFYTALVSDLPSAQGSLEEQERKALVPVDQGGVQSYYIFATEGGSRNIQFPEFQYDLKDSSPALHAGIAQPTAAAYYSYDHCFGQYDRYGTVDFGNSSRRKNATRETTSTLKTWLYEHRKNPYPTKGEKIMLAIITKMTLTQVSTWFANARRRLKKENKMTWSPKNKAGDEQREGSKRNGEDCSSENEDKDPKICKEEKELQLSDLEDLDEEESDMKAEDELKHLHQDGLIIGRELTESEKSSCTGSPASHFHAFSCAKQHSPITGDFLGYKGNTITGSLGTQGQLYEAPEKPRIWSLAHTAGANMIVGSTSNPAQRTESPDCLLLRGRCSGTDGQCSEGRPLGNLVRTQPIHDKALEELPQPAKIFKSSTFNLQSIALNYASYPVLGETCQYAAGTEGFRRSIRAAQSSLDLSDVCLSQHKEKLRTAFRPVLKR